MMRKTAAYTVLQVMIFIGIVGVILMALFALVGWFKTVALFVMSWAFIGTCIIVALIVGFLLTRKKKS